MTNVEKNMADNELEIFKNWNPMKQDFENPDYNKYDVGPGASLPAELQVGHVSHGTATKIRYPFLVFYSVPSSLTKEGLHNLCSKYGRVHDIRKKKMKQMYFVDFITIA